MSPSVRRAVALLVALAALALLAVRAVESVTPLGTSLSVAKRFWRAARPPGSSCPERRRLHRLSREP
jgi:hypothetical protein